MAGGFLASSARDVCIVHEVCRYDALNQHNCSISKVSSVMKFADLLKPHSCSRSNSIIRDVEFFFFALQATVQKFGKNGSN